VAGVEPAAYLAKAEQNLAAADAALGSGHYDVCGSRAYYAAFQAAVAALWAEGIRPLHERDRTLSHKGVHSEWSGRLIYRRKQYPADLRGTLQWLYDVRIDADYHAEPVTERVARRAALRARQLVAAVAAHLEAQV
jgi:uncharacterized protein (UPF0332 family)